MAAVDGYRFGDLNRISLGFQDCIAQHSPSQDSSEEGRVEALWRRQPPLHLRHRHLVLGRGAEQGQPAGDGAEDLMGSGGQWRPLPRVLVSDALAQVAVIFHL